MLNFTSLSATLFKRAPPSPAPSSQCHVPGDARAGCCCCCRSAISISGGSEAERALFMKSGARERRRMRSVECDARRHCLTVPAPRRASPRRALFTCRARLETLFRKHGHARPLYRSPGILRTPLLTIHYHRLPWRPGEAGRRAPRRLLIQTVEEGTGRGGERGLQSHRQ